MDRRDLDRDDPAIQHAIVPVPLLFRGAWRGSIGGVLQKQEPRVLQRLREKGFEPLCDRGERARRMSHGGGLQGPMERRSNVGRTIRG